MESNTSVAGPDRVKGRLRYVDGSQGRDLRPWLVMLPIALVVVVFVYPLFVMARSSFTDFVEAGQSGLANYEWFLGTGVQRTVLQRTFLVSVAVTGMCILLGFPYAYLMTLAGPTVRILMLGTVMLPFWSSIVVRIYAWVILLQQSGPVDRALALVGADHVRLLGNVGGVFVGSTQVLLPFFILPLYSSLTRIDRRLLDAAHSLGARPSRAFVQIYLPLALPGVIAGALITFILMLGFYFTPAMLGSPQNSLISQQVVEQVTRLLAFGRGGAMALTLLLLTVIVLAVAARLSRRYVRSLGFGEKG
ncbi:ABC transporter permease [Mycolicibacterium sp.]|uniref:ABC transporter permease n=1 Tax=Mycolicibacterium sp. TaxID=2320850 RepID=UPI003D135D1A